MGHEGTFQRVGKTDQRMYGPRGVLVCGYPASEHSFFLSLMEKNGLAAIPVIFVTDEDAAGTLSAALALEDRHGEGEDSRMARAVVMSGFTQKEIHTLINAYRKSGRPSQLWATLTPVSEKWSVSALLTELAAEAEAVRRQRR